MCAAPGGTFKNVVPLTAHLPLLFLPLRGKNSTLFIIYYLFFIICLFLISRLQHPNQPKPEVPHVPYRKIQKT